MDGTIRYILPLLILLSGCVAFIYLDYNQIADLKEEIKGLNQVSNPQTIITKSATGETVASQPKAEVSKETFSNLMDDKLAEFSKKTNQDLGKVLSVVEAKLTTDRIVKVPVHDTTVIRITVRDTIRVPAKVLKWQSKFESGTVLTQCALARVSGCNSTPHFFASHSSQSPRWQSATTCSIVCFFALGLLIYQIPFR